MPRWELVTVRMLRAAVLASAAFFIASGDEIFGAFCVISVILAVTPGFAS